ncbi:hypothetical protein EVG20_g4382 [Dentipellis fragilis]|uniref:Kinetochore protein SPC25 n=1 Tax=Dentipellis fragilis TaxID=205917 RepID=A0A4Y9Z010_9AGAM|nr:hypothetical protein EVG20_g4382 [Dentipellis fragilis]
MMAQTFRTPQIDLTSILSAQTPEIDLRLGAYEASTRNFLKAIGDYTNRAVTEINRRRNNYIAEKKKLSDRVQSVEAETNQCKVDEIGLLASLEKEQEETKEAESSVAVFRRQLTSVRETFASLDTEIEHYRAVTNSLRREKGRERGILDKLSSQEIPELQASVDAIGCTIEGVGRDQLLFQFHNVNPADLRQQFTFVLDMSGNTYRALSSSPQLLTLPILVDELNDTKDIYTFVKNLRQSFLRSIS